MSNTLVLPGPMWAALQTHLRQGVVEQAAIVFANSVETGNDLRLEAIDAELLADYDFEHQSAYHIALTDDCQARIIQTAWATKRSIIEFHSHIESRYAPCFSPSDLAGFESFVPHVWWRLKGQSYAAVVTTSNGFDALVWRTSPRSPERLAAIEVDGRMERPSNEAVRWMKVAHV